MKIRILIFTALLIGLCSCGHKKHGPEEKPSGMDLSGQWELVQWNGSAFGKRVYLNIEGTSFDLYQGIGAEFGIFEHFAGTLTLTSEGNETTFSGTYEDGAPFSESYRVELSKSDDPAQFRLTGLSSGSISLYTSCIIPATVFTSLKSPLPIHPIVPFSRWAAYLSSYQYRPRGQQRRHPEALAEGFAVKADPSLARRDDDRHTG